MPRTWITRQLNAAQDRDLHSRLHDSPRLTMGNKRKERYLSQQGTPSNYTTVQNHSPSSPFSPHPPPTATPDQGNWKKKKQNTPLARPDCSSGRGVSKSPRNGTGMKYHNPGLSVPPATRWGPARVPASVSPSVNDGGPKRKTESCAAPPQALWSGSPATRSHPGSWRWAAGADIRGSAARGS